MVVAYLQRQPNLVFGLLLVGLLVWMSGTGTAPTTRPGTLLEPFEVREAPVKRSTVPEISIGEALAAIARGAVVIDVRDRDVYEKSHIEGAVSVPLAELKRQAPDYALLSEQELIIYCGNGSNLGPEGTRALNDAGHGAAKNLAAGLSGWEAAGHPVTTGAK